MSKSIQSVIDNKSMKTSFIGVAPVGWNNGESEILTLEGEMEILIFCLQSREILKYEV
jgi:hypothetical protein